MLQVALKPRLPVLLRLLRVASSCVLQSGLKRPAPLGMLRARGELRTWDALIVAHSLVSFKTLCIV